VSCASASLCIAFDVAGNVITTARPTGGPSAWRLAHIERDPNGLILDVACTSLSMCVATDSVGNVIASANPTGGRAAWTLRHVDGTTRIKAVSCPARALCTAVDDAGRLLVGHPNPAALSSAQVQGLLRRELVPSRRQRRLGALLAHSGYQLAARALSAGRLQIAWYLRGVRVAKLMISFPNAGTAKRKLSLTPRGRALLRRARDPKLIARATFKPLGLPAVHASASFRL
jgi:hypothetical protein